MTYSTQEHVQSCPTSHTGLEHPWTMVSVGPGIKPVDSWPLGTKNGEKSMLGGVSL